MGEAEVLDVSRDAIFTMLVVAGPLMLVALVVGLVISLIQALTQIQEQTLAFVPKIVCMFGALLALMPFMLATMSGFMDRIGQRIIGIGLG